MESVRESSELGRLKHMMKIHAKSGNNFRRIATKVGVSYVVSEEWLPKGVKKLTPF